jgi:hypothetical protein
MWNLRYGVKAILVFCLPIREISWEQAITATSGTQLSDLRGTREARDQ